MDVTIHNANPGTDIDIPASKSHSIRALLIAALAEGESIIANPLDSKDTRSCIEAIKSLGAQVAEKGDGYSGYPGAIRVKGVGDSILSEGAENVIDCGNSGTTAYLAASIAALSPEYTVFTGDGQIRSRPIRELLSSLRDLGALAFTTRNKDAAPFVVRGPLTGGTTEISCPTSQYLSSLLLAVPLLPAGSSTEINITLLHERPYAEITLDWLDYQKIRYENQNWKRITIPGGQKYRAFTRSIPADFSSATFFACAAAITGEELFLRGLDMEDSQGDKDVFVLLRQMGCRVTPEDDGVRISGPDYASGQELKAGNFDLNSIPDALPALAVTAAYARGKTILGNVPQARLKETDRIRCMARELEKMNIRTQELDDGLVIHGGTVVGAAVNGHQDHRIVMACSIAGLRSKGAMTVSDAQVAGVTFPGFFDILAKSVPIDGSGSCVVFADNSAPQRNTRQ